MSIFVINASKKYLLSVYDQSGGKSTENKGHGNSYTFWASKLIMERQSQGRLK